MSSKILVVGHRNPDNDSIAAAVGYAHLKNALAARDGEADAVEYVPARLGPLPVESAWILEQNDIAEPVLIENVNLSLIHIFRVRAATPACAAPPKRGSQA